MLTRRALLAVFFFGLCLIFTACRAKDSCTADTECSAAQVCRESVCRTPRFPVLNEHASDRATYDIKGENLLVTGRKITPAGEQVFVGTQPTRVAVTPDGKFAVVNESTWGSNNQSPSEPTTFYLRVIDLATMQVTQSLAAPNRLLWHGMTLVQDGGNAVWATDGRGNHLHKFALAVTGALTYVKSVPVPDCYTTDVVIDTSLDRAYVTCLKSEAFKLAGMVKFVNLTTGLVEYTADIDGAFSLLLTPDGKHLYVTSLATDIQPEGDAVTVFDTVAKKKLVTLAVGLGPEGMAYDAAAKKVYVACNRTDDVYVIDDADLEVDKALSLHEEPAPLKGYFPVRLALNGDDLYVTASHESALVVLDKTSGKVKGLIPTGWYPNDLAFLPGGKTLVVSNGRGVGDGPSLFPGPNRAPPGRALRGTVAKLAVPDAGALAAFTKQVAANNDRQSTYYDFSGGNDTPLPSPSPVSHPSHQIKHVFFIFKENFSYDAAYGDFERGEGKPEYTLWPETIIPNQRKLAREYTIFDNFYCQTDSSLDGHAWASVGIETDFMEKYNWHADGFGTIAVSLTPGTAAQSKFFLPHLLAQGISVLGYGGIENFGAGALGEYRDYMVPGFHWNTEPDKTDVGRAKVFQTEFAKRLEAGTMPSFSWIFLGNNHTFGLTVGEPIPEYWVGENDLAVGMVIGTIAASPLWKDSLIFITEDDSQSGYDHIDKHRCPALAIGPWVKRGYTSHVVYTINNFHKTAELLLGSSPMHRLDNMAVGMYDVFTARPDVTPYEPVLKDVPRTLWDGSDKDLEGLSARMDWSEIDRNPDAGELFWRYRKGTEPPAQNLFYRSRAGAEVDGD